MDQKVVTGHLTPTGIAYNEARTVAFCFAQQRRAELSYKNILSVEQFQIGHYLIKYVSETRSPHFVDEMMVKITDSVPRSTTQNVADDVALLAESSENGVSPSTTSAAGSGPGSVEAEIFARAYANCELPHMRKPVLVMINPKSGPGEAQRLYTERSAPIFAAAGLKTEVIVTRSSGEATQIAQKLPMDDYDTLVLVSGDGLPHEVLNGLASRGDESRDALRHFGICQLPGGSGNAMSLALNHGEREWAQLTLSILKGRAEPHDIMVVSQGSQLYYSFLSQSYGIVADCDLGTEHLRWMGGSRFIVGLIYKVLRAQSYPCEIAYKEGSASDDEMELPNVNDPIPSDWTVESHRDLSMFYVGKMDWMSADARMFPHADALDGSMDMIMWDTSFGWFNSLNAFASVETGRHVGKIPFYKKIRSYRLTPLVNNQYLSIDGESYPLKPFQVSIVPGAASFIRNQFTHNN